MRRTAVILAALALTFARADAQTNAPAQQSEAAAPISVAPANAAEGDWVLAPKDYANTRFSTLDQITPQNVKDLKVAWTFSTGVNAGKKPRRSSPSRRCTSSRRIRTFSTRST